MPTSSIYAIYDGFDNDFEEDRYLLAIYIDLEEAQMNAKQYCDPEEHESIQIVEFPIGTAPMPEIPEVKVVFHWHCCEND